MNNEDEEKDSFFPEANEEQILGLVWSETYKGGKKNLPSMNEIVTGLYEHVSKFIEDKLRNEHNKNFEKIQLVKKQYKETFDHILDCLDYQKTDKSLTREELSDPMNKATCAILYFYSMEPPIYADMNKASRQLVV